MGSNCADATHQVSRRVDGERVVALPRLCRVRRERAAEADDQTENLLQAGARWLPAADPASHTAGSREYCRCRHGRSYDPDRSRLKVFQPGDQFRQARHRHHHILVQLVGGNGVAPARVPCVLPKASDSSLGASQLMSPSPAAAVWIAAAKFSEQSPVHRPRSRAVRRHSVADRPAVAADHLDGRGIHELQRARRRGLRHDARDRRGRLGDAGVHHQAPCFRQRREFSSLGDDGERALEPINKRVRS